MQVSGRTYQYSLPDMAEAHRQSFFKFLNQGLVQELEQIFPIYLQKGKIQVNIDPDSIVFEAPKLTIKEAFLQRTTYNISVYFLVTFIDWEKNLCKKEWVSFGSIPICTSGGWFLVRGLRRIVLHQLIRSAGCYASLLDEDVLNQADFQNLIPLEQVGLTLFKRFEILILPQQGTWLRFFISPTGLFSIQWGKTKDQRSSIFIFLRARILNEPFPYSFYRFCELCKHKFVFKPSKRFFFKLLYYL